MSRQSKDTRDLGDVTSILESMEKTRASHFQQVELALVHGQVRLGRRAYSRPIALTLNHLGNGWLYPILATLLFWFSPANVVGLFLEAGIAAGVAHLIYPLIKRVVKRPRPFDVDARLSSMLPVLDNYSFPSGHCMTFTAVAIPLCSAFPALITPAVLVGLGIGWARIVAAHHYLSDILAGVVLGALVALTLATL